MRTVQILLAFGLLCGSISAQAATWFVDPVSGNNANTGTSANDAFQSLTFAIGNVALASGDTITLNGGVYSDAGGTNGAGNRLEVWPIVVPSGVEISSGSTFSPPVFDGESVGFTTPVLFEISSDLNVGTATLLEGLELLNFDRAIATNNLFGAPVVTNLIIAECTFSEFTEYGIFLEFKSGQPNAVLVEQCSFVGGQGATAGVRVNVSDNATLSGGGIYDCTFNNFLVAADVEASTRGTISSGYKVLRNIVTNFSAIGIRVAATQIESSNNTVVRGNVVVGDGVTGNLDIGLSLEVEASASGFTTAVGGLVSYNDFSLADINVRCAITPVLGSSTAITSAFVGNTLRNATTYGFQARVMNGLNTNEMMPDLGQVPLATAGRNTIDNANADFEVDLLGNMSGQILMSNNFWPSTGGSPQARVNLNGNLPPVISTVLSDELVGFVNPSIVDPDTPDTLRLTLTTGRFVVQVEETGLVDTNASAGEFGQFQLFQLIGPAGTINIQPSDISTLDPAGTFLEFVIPPLAAGNYTIQYTNPGFQQLQPVGLRTTGSSSGGGGGGGGCVVATAAHGDYNAPEVKILRNFRDQYLLPYVGGRAAVRNYYQHGEPMAAFIAEREWARKATRASLVAPTLVAYSLIHWNTGQRFFMGVMLLGLLLWIKPRKLAPSGGADS
jgi:hypothetical protein